MGFRWTADTAQYELYILDVDCRTGWVLTLEFDCMCGFGCEVTCVDVDCTTR